MRYAVGSCQPDAPLWLHSAREPFLFFSRQHSGLQHTYLFFVRAGAVWCSTRRKGTKEGLSGFPACTHDGWDAPRRCDMPLLAAWPCVFEDRRRRQRTAPMSIRTGDSKGGALDVNPSHLPHGNGTVGSGRVYCVGEGRDGALSITTQLMMPFEPLKWQEGATVSRRPNGGVRHPVLFAHRGLLWVYNTVIVRGQLQLELYFALDVEHEWKKHPQSPVAMGPETALCGGRVREVNGVLVRPALDVSLYEGQQMRAYAVTLLTPTSYEERPLMDEPMLEASGRGWRALGSRCWDALEEEDEDGERTGDYLVVTDGYESMH